jgi:hypothetical protein
MACGRPRESTQQPVPCGAIWLSRAPSPWVGGRPFELIDPSGRRLARVPVGPGSDLQMDSIRVRPPTLRFNSRGQAAPGSIYLYLGVRTVRIVSNFLGRLRVESSGPH